MDDDLRFAVGRRFEQDGIEIDLRLQPARPCLHSLCPTNLAAIDGDRRIERHVLRFERRHPHSPARQYPAQRRHHRRFAGIGGGALHHQGVRDHREGARGKSRHYRCGMLLAKYGTHN